MQANTRFNRDSGYELYTGLLDSSKQKIEGWSSCRCAGRMYNVTLEATPFMQTINQASLTATLFSP